MGIFFLTIACNTTWPGIGKVLRWWERMDLSSAVTALRSTSKSLLLTSKHEYSSTCWAPAASSQGRVYGKINLFVTVVIPIIFNHFEVSLTFPSVPWFA